MISYADYFQVWNAGDLGRPVYTYLKNNNSLGIPSSTFIGGRPPSRVPSLYGFWRVSKNDMAMAASTFPDGNQMKSIMNRLEKIENKIRRIEAYNDYNLDSNDYTYTDD